VLLSSPFFLEGLTLAINHHGEERRFLRHQPDPGSSRKRNESHKLRTKKQRRVSDVGCHPLIVASTVPPEISKQALAVAYDVSGLSQSIRRASTVAFGVPGIDD
jgi:hypothetical protein